MIFTEHSRTLHVEAKDPITQIGKAIFEDFKKGAGAKLNFPHPDNVFACQFKDGVLKFLYWARENAVKGSPQVKTFGTGDTNRLLGIVAECNAEEPSLLAYALSEKRELFEEYFPTLKDFRNRF